MLAEKIKPIHPGEILMEEFLIPLGISQYRLAKDIHVSPMRINDIIHCRRAVTSDTALRLARYLNISPQFWLGLQMDYDIAVAEDDFGDKIEHQIKRYA